MNYNEGMKTTYLDDYDLKMMASTLLDGGLIAIPTDTVFGLACIYDDSDAITKVKTLKGRDANKALPMMCSDLAMVKTVAETDDRIERIIERLTPGALTMIMKKKDSVADYVTSGLPTIGIRIPDDKDILNLIDYLGKPLLVTSCNISGAPSIRYYREVIAIFADKIDVIVRKDALSEVASTVVDLTGDALNILREGAITERMILEV